MPYDLSSANWECLALSSASALWTLLPPEGVKKLEIRHPERL
jgi:hypothetical protein